MAATPPLDQDIRTVERGVLPRPPVIIMPREIGVCVKPTTRSRTCQDKVCTAYMSGNAILAFVCDGHGVRGDEVANLVVCNFPVILEERLKTTASVTLAIFEACDLTNQLIKEIPNPIPNAGSTLAGVYFNAISCWSFGVGDSSVFLNAPGINPATPVVAHHLLSDSGERARVLSVGGRVLYNRVAGTILITRAFGDFDIRGIICTPTVVQTELPEFICIASDGVTDGEQPAGGAIATIAARCHDSASSVAAWIVDSAPNPGHDDVSAVVIYAREYMAKVQQPGNPLQ